MEHAFKWHLYSLAGSDWYESPSRIATSEQLVAAVRQHLGDWQLDRRDIHVFAGRDDLAIRKQGWKIHCSATVDSAVDVLSRVAEVCGRVGTPFKFVASVDLVAQVNSRSWPRAAAGKFITIYPRDDEHFLQMLDELYEQLKDCFGPYILSDRRYRDCKVLYYRYGSHELTYQLLPDGRKMPMLRAPDGRLEEEQRRPYWLVPSWVDELVDDPPSARANADNSIEYAVIGRRFRVEKALAFSSEGGIYRALDMETGATCVLREARPHCVTDVAGLDAVARQRRHHAIISRLSGLGFTPRPIALFRQWEHSFLAESYLESIDTLFHYIVINNPLVQAKESPPANRRYLGFCLDIAQQLLAIQEVLESNDIIYTDLSTTNVCIRSEADGSNPRVAIVDFGSALDRASILLSGGVVETTAGFRRPGGINLAEIHGLDSFAFGALLMSMLLPVAAMFDVAPETAERLTRTFGAELNAPAPLVRAISSLLVGENLLDYGGQRRIRDLLAEARACVSDAKSMQRLVDMESLVGHVSRHGQEMDSQSSTIDACDLAPLRDALEKLNAYIIDVSEPVRADRLFPADPSVFETNPLSVAFGAAGVMYALELTGADIPADVWRAYTRLLWSGSDLPPGLYTGVAGVVWATWSMGMQDAALELANGLCRLDDFQTWDVFSGAAGIGLTLLRLYAWTTEQRFLDAAVQAGDAILHAGTLNAGTGWPAWKNATGSIVEAGYALGRSGIAEFLLHLWRATDDERFIKMGIQSLGSAVDQGIRTDDKLSIPAERNYSGPIRSHYWYQGTAGTFSVAVKYRSILGERVEEVLPIERLASMSRDLKRRYTIYPSLLKGMAGLADSLLDGFIYLGERSWLEAAAGMANRLLTFAVPRSAGLALPGEQLMRLSTDIASGNAGVVLFLHRLVSCLSGQEPASNNFSLDARR